MSFPDEAFREGLARRILTDYAFTASDLPETDRAAVVDWIASYPGAITMAARDFAEALFDLLPLHNLDTTSVAITVINGASDAASILEARDRRARATDTPGEKPDPAFMSWLRRELDLAGFPPSAQQPLAGKRPLPIVLYARLKREAAREGRAAPAFDVSEDEEDALLRRLLEKVARAEPHSGDEE